MTEISNSAQKNNDGLNGLILPDDDSPLYEMKRQQLKWARTPLDARNSLWTIFLVVVSVVILSGIAVMTTNIGLSLCNTCGPHWSNGYTFSFIVSLILLHFILDFGAIWVSSSNTDDRKMLRQWNLSSQALNQDQLTQTKHAFARLRIARLLTLNLSFRFALLLTFLIFILHDFALRYFSFPFYYELNKWLQSLYQSPFETVLFLFFWTLLLVFYFIEPLWRVDAITALGIALSEEKQKGIWLFASVFRQLIVFWLTQIIIIFAIYNLIFIVNDTLFPPTWYGHPTIEYLGANQYYVALCFGVTYGFYYGIKKLAYRQIRAWIKRGDM